MQRVLKTLLAMLETRPFNEITIADLARRADAAVTSIYARFEDKRALLLAAHQLHSEEVIEQIDRAFDPSHLQSASVPEVIEAALVQAMKTFSRRKNLHRAVLAAADPDVALRAAEMIRHFSQRVTQLIQGKLRGLDDEEVARRTDFALAGRDGRYAAAHYFRKCRAVPIRSLRARTAIAIARDDPGRSAGAARSMTRTSK